MADWVIVAVSDDAEQAREDAKRQIAFHATVRTYDRHPGAARLRRRRRADQRAVAELRPGRDDGAGHRRDARRDGGRRHRRRLPHGPPAAGRGADRLLLGAPVVATDPDADPGLPRRDRGDRSAPAGADLISAARGARLGAPMEGWTIFYMVVILKIPMVAALWLVWWAIKNEPTPEEETGEDRGPRRKLPPLPALATPGSRRAGAAPGASRRRARRRRSCGPPARRRSTRAARRTRCSGRSASGSTGSRTRRLYCRTARESRCIPTLRLTRWSALSTVFVSHSSRSATSS